MDKPGNVLRTEREKQKRSLQEISRSLRIKIEYLIAIENDDYSMLPADVFTKAYLRLYADSLGLESNYILGLYKPVQVADFVEMPAPPKENMFISRLKGMPLPGLKPLLIVMVLFLIILSIAVVTKYRMQKTPESISNEKTVEDVVADKKTDAMSLKIAATELTWVSVRIDDGKPEERLLRTGETMKVNALNKFAVKIGNAGGTRLIFNNKDIGKLGKHGKIVDIVLP